MVLKLYVSVKIESSLQLWVSTELHDERGKARLHVVFPADYSVSDFLAVFLQDK